MQISTLIGKTVLSRTGKCLGYVIALRLTRDMKKISCLVCADADEEEFCLPARAIRSVEDAVMAGTSRIPSPTGITSPIGRPVYSHTGEFLGRIKDVDTGEQPDLIILAPEGERRIPLSCAVMGETVIAYPTEEERRKSKPRDSRHRTDPGKTAAVQQAPAQADPAPVPPPSPEPVPAESAGRDPQPTPRTPEAKANAYRLDRTNLLGRRVKKSVFDAEGQPVARAGERITAEILSRARRSNRLLALTVNTLTNIY